LFLARRKQGLFLFRISMHPDASNGIVQPEGSHDKVPKNDLHASSAHRRAETKPENAAEAKGGPMKNPRVSTWQACGGFLTVAGLFCVGCALIPEPVQMYEGASLPKEQVGIVRSACQTESGLSIMIVKIDSKDISDVCADFALLPGEHHMEVSGKRIAPRIDTPMIRSGSALGAPPSPMGATPGQESSVIWASRSPLPITCTIQAGQEVTIVGTAGTGPDWEARCQERAGK
jgi:hypothetical protein